MSWSESDISFKKLNNKRITTNTGKGLAEERGASTIELYAGDLKTDTIPGTPPVSSTSVVQVYDYAGKLQLVPDFSVPDNMTWFATTITGDDVTANDGSNTSESARLKDWISDKYDDPGTIPGAGYEIKVYDASNNLITKSDPSQWFFDYQTGILMFKNTTTAYGSVSTSGPFSIVGYRYIGAKGIGSGSGSVTSISTTGGIQGGPITTSGTISLDLTYSPEWIGTHTFLKNALAVSYVNAINISNKTASSSGSSNQYSPSLEWIGNVWNTTSAAGNTARFSTRLETTQGLSPSGQLVFKSSVDTGTASWTDRFIIKSTGQVEIPGTLKINTYDGALFASSGVVSNGTLPVIYGGLGVSSFTKGDIIVGAGTSIIKLGVGSASQILTVDSSTATGLKWSDPSAVGAGLSSLNGLTSINQYFTVGYSGSQFNIVSSGSTHTFNIPYAGTGSTGLVSTTAQTFAGSKTFQDDINASANIVLTGAITSGSWAGNAITGLYGGLGYTSYSLGDILVGAGSTFIKLPVGTNDYVLTADSTSTSGLKWSPTAATGITTLNSLTATTQFFAVGTSGSGFNISSSGSTHTFNIPIAGSGSTGLITTLSQTIAGQKTFTSAIVGDLSGTATSSTNVNIVNASSNATHPVLFTTASGTLSGAAVSSNSTISFNPSSFILSTSGLAVTSGIASTTFNTGALVVTGGVGIGGSLNVNGDLTVNGTTTTINSVTVTVDDKNIELGSVNSPTDLTAEGGGITLKGATDKFINWYSGTGWSSNQDWNLASGLAYKINNTSVLSATSLGTGVTNSSLTALGTITTGTWAGSIITSLYGGTGYSTYTKGDLLVGVGNTLFKFPVGNDLTILAADSSAATGVTWKGLLAPTYGAFASTSTQTITGANTVTFINFDTTFAANNVTIGTGTTNRIYINDTGLFDVQFSIQLDLAVSNQDQEVDIWFVVDGVYVPTSNTRQTVSGKNKETVITVNLVQSFISGQYVQLAYSSPAADLQIAAFSNLTGPTRPDIPGVILTVEPVSSIFPGSGLAITGLASLNLLTANAQTLVTGTSGIDFNISSIGSVHTFNIPDASTTARGLITTGSQTLLGSKTFASGVAITATTASTGSTTGALIVSGGVGIGGSLFTSASYANSISGLAISNGVIFNGSWAGSLITARYGGTGYSSYSKGDLLVGAGGTFIKLGTGTNGYVLGLDSSLPAGLGWTTVSGVTISTTPPSGPKNADLWFNSEDGSLSVYYQDIDTSQWVEIALGSGIDLTSSVHITSTIGSTNSSTGALIVDGGVGVAGTVNASSFVVNGIYDEIGTSLTTSSITANQVALSLSTSVYRSAKIFVQASSGSTYHSQEIMMLHDGSNVYMTEYAMVNSGAIGSTFDGDISGGNMRFLVTPSYAVTTYKIACSAMRI